MVSGEAEGDSPGSGSNEQQAFGEQDDLPVKEDAWKLRLLLIPDRVHRINHLLRTRNPSVRSFVSNMGP